MNRLETLPEDCMSKILSLTSPVDVVRSSVLSKAIKSAADSDLVWKAFLPSDVEDILSRSGQTHLTNATSKELYLTLSDSPLILDGGKMSFSLEKRSGNKCYLIAAKELIICWESSAWRWTSHSNSRFSEVAELASVCWLDIRGKLQTNKLSLRSNYAAYLVFQLAQGSCGLDSAKSVIRLVNNEIDNSAERRASTLHLAQSDRRMPVRGTLPNTRVDGWLEVKMGSFYNDQGDDGEVEARLIEIEHLNLKSGLILEGIEFRPTSN